MAQQMCSFSRFSFVTLIYSIPLSPPYRMPDHSLAFLRCHPPCITQINFVVHSLISNIQCISLFFHKSVHLIYCSRLIVIRSDMHTLYTQTFIIRKELNFGEILFLFLRSFLTAQSKSSLLTKSGKRITEIHLNSSLRA